MFLYKGLVVSMLAVAVSCKLTPRQSPYYEKAESAAQTTFAEENNYDQTGPGAVETQGAFKTYNTLGEAIIGYLNDPDTKLPDAERDRVYYDYLKKPISLLTQDVVPRKLFDEQKYYLNQATVSSVDQFSELGAEGLIQVPKYSHAKEESDRYKPLRTISLNLLKNPLTVQPKPIQTIMESPDYAYSYGVHDGSTGDTKAAHESRSGGTVTGYYTLVEPGGLQRTVHYAADGSAGFRALVHRARVDTARL